MPALFHHDVAVAVLGSGSRGNATYIGDGRHGVLIDCGLSTKQILTRLDAVGLSGAPIDAVLLTHEHTDHVAAARILDRTLFRRTGRHVPFYLSDGTRRGLSSRTTPTRLERVVPGRPFRLGTWRVEPYTVPHDTADPTAFVVEIGPLRVGVVTDLGSTNPLVRSKVASLDVAVVEFNHDVEMLRDGPYPWHLKQRIRGRLGHLSNDQALDLVADAAATGRLKHLVLAHLSEDNNTEEHALRAAETALYRAGRRDVSVGVGKQREALAPRRLRAPLAPPPSPARSRPAKPKRTPAPPPGQGSLFGQAR